MEDGIQACQDLDKQRRAGREFRQGGTIWAQLPRQECACLQSVPACRPSLQVTGRTAVSLCPSKCPGEGQCFIHCSRSCTREGCCPLHCHTQESEGSIPAMSISLQRETGCLPTPKRKNTSSKGQQYFFFLPFFCVTCGGCLKGVS